MKNKKEIKFMSMEEYIKMEKSLSPFKYMDKDRLGHVHFDLEDSKTLPVKQEPEIPYVKIEIKDPIEEALLIELDIYNNKTIYKWNKELKDLIKVSQDGDS